MRKTRNSIITSAISLLLCIIMLAGSTFAWFTDIVASNGNIIQSGNLDAQLHWSDKLLDADSSEWIDAEGSKVFDYDRWEPGYTELRYIKVTNAGSLNLKWKLTVEANGPVTSLADVIEVYYVNPVTGELASLDGLESVGTLTEVMAEKTSSQGRLTPKQNAILAIAFHMDEYAGNEYQEISLCDNGFSLKLLATQDVGESDSFGDDYDIDADWGEGTITFTASAPISQVPMIYGTLAGDITIGSGSNISALLPSGVKVAEGATSLDLSVSAVDTDSNITLGDGDSAKSLDVHVYGVATDNTVPMIVNLGAVLEAGLGDTELKLYHTEDGSPVLMTRVDSTSDFAIHNQYTYNTETGEVSIYVKSFSVFSAVKTAADEWDGTSDTSWYNESDTEFTLDTAEKLAGFRDLVDAGKTFEGKTVKLGADIDLKEIPFDPIGFGYYKDNKVVDGVDNNTVFLGTFDGGNHTIYNLYQNCWELDPDKVNYSTYTYSTAGAGLFASIKNATIKNLAISDAEVVFECVDMGVLVGYAQGKCHFENIVITNANIANYNRYTGGLVGEVSYGPYGTDTTLGYSHTFKNITIDSTVKVSGLWGSFGCGMGGVIGGKWNDATVYMENVISAAEMDVYNDVVSAYQWYAFRGCGMLIGHTEEPYSDGRTSGIATANFLTCENVKVYYGDWVNYTYYEFENQDSGTGRSYPWVRAEAGEYCDAFSNIRYGVPTHNGIKVSDLTDKELKAVATDYTPIVFDQLYGADRGMYGQAAHYGVTTSQKNVKTIYIQNNLGWENLKVHYWYVKGNDTWTNLDESGLALTEENGVYKIEVPAYAYGFRITADGENVTRDFYLSEVVEGSTYSLDFEHVHYFVGNNCVCGTVKIYTEHTFNLGEDGEAKHSDGGNAVTTYEENGFTLTLERLSSVYGNAHDAIGNSCIKLGTNSLTGGFSFDVSTEVEKVIIYVTGYKSNDTTIEVNGIQHVITTHSNDGEYTAIEVDTSETKTVSFTTVEVNGESRCMINTIVFVTSRVIEDHDCDENAEIHAIDPTCTETGLAAGKACSVCGKVMIEQETIPATGHTEETIPAVDATCTKNGSTEGAKCSVCDETVVKPEIILYTGHNYIEGTCSKCGEAFPTTSGTYTYVFNKYNEGIQYAQGEVHVLDENVTITTYDCHFTSELRIYSSSTNDGYATIFSVNPISKIGVNAGNKVDKINIYGSHDGETWTTDPVAIISVTSTSYNDYEVSLNGEYKYLKLDVAGANQVRIKSMTLTLVPDCAHASITEKVVAPTCTEAGRTDTVCLSCGQVISTVDGSPATGHINTTTTTVDATCTEAGSTTVTCDDCGETVSTEVIPATGHTYVGGICGCGAEDPSYELETPTESEWIKTDFANIKSTDVVVIVWTTSNGVSYAISNNNGTGSAPQAIVVTVDGNQLTGDIADNIKWNIANSSGNLTIYPNGTTTTWLYCTSTNNGVRVGTNANKVFTIDASSGYLKNTATSRYIGVYTTNPDIRCYTSTTTNIADQNLSFYLLTGAGTSGGDNGSSEGGETEHTHNYVGEVTTAATCTSDGIMTYTCTCGEGTYTEAIEATGHNYVDGTCSLCGEKDPNAGGLIATETLTFDNTSKRTEYSTTKQVWTENGITLTNNKSSSTNNVADYSKPVRLYANSKIVVEASGKISKIVFDCNSSSYATALKNSIGSVSGATVTVSSDKVTVEFSEAVDSFTIAKLTAQVRLDSITVTYISNN